MVFPPFFLQVFFLRVSCQNLGVGEVDCGAGPGCCAWTMPRGVKRGPEGVVAEQQASRKEKRLSRFRAQPSKDIVARIERALSQRLFLVGRQVSPQLQSFAVLGSTGNVYDVVISQTPSCTCPDHAKGNLCKHILFVFLRVLRLSRDNPLVWQTALLASEAHRFGTPIRERTCAKGLLRESLQLGELGLRLNERRPPLLLRLA